ncbi:MAG TPA: tRNA (adenosine(37)-N6)-threonylcarbamoyltransferase complex dimerization subunit type 1 TsaB [Thermoanaerobaculia bacterium]|nr:tRNA (adenosine(37)-N6)-threonylcarbamoyltransferase complex dimerization subunit type 1 TsaB [Thermoanaerobaculia bacterium]
MLTLAIDTSLPILSVAVTREGQQLASAAVEGKNSRNEKLLVIVDWLLGEAGVALHDLELLAVTRGPGSFTGVRVALATVLGMSLALRRPVCAMSTHEAIASAMEGETLIYGDAGRGEFYVSAFRGREELLPASLLTRSELDEKSAAFPSSISVDEALRTSNVALLLAVHATRIAASGQLAAYADQTPIYVRLAEAEARLLKKGI